MSIMEYNGSGIVAMCGKECVAIASDLRYGIQQLTLADNFPKIFRMHDRLYVGLSGLATDMQTMHAKLDFRMKLYELKEERLMKPRAFGAMFSSMLYEKRFGPYFVEPVIAGLEEDEKGNFKPYINAMDLIGAGCEPEDFVCAGTSTEELMGTCEAMYKKNLEAEDLFETISQALLAAVDRDCLAGWGAIVHVITPTEVISRQLKSRKD